MNLNISQIKDSWTTKGFSCHLWSDPSGKEWIDYVHDADELLMLVEGAIEITIGKRTFRPQLGEEVLIPEKVVHSVRNVGIVENRWLYGYKIKELPKKH